VDELTAEELVFTTEEERMTELNAAEERVPEELIEVWDERLC
jgi:hypothetical protein